MKSALTKVRWKTGCNISMNGTAGPWALCSQPIWTTPNASLLDDFGFFFAVKALNDMSGICWRGHDLAPDQLQRHCRNRIM